MPEDSGIGLSEFISQIKSDLLNEEVSPGGPPPLFSIDEVSVDLGVTVHKGATGGVSIKVLEVFQGNVGGQLEHDLAHRVTLTLSPLLSREERIRLYQERHPEQWEEIQDVVSRATLKGSAEQSLQETFGN